MHGEHVIVGGGTIHIDPQAESMGGPLTFWARRCADCGKCLVSYVSPEEQLAMKAGVRTGRLCVGCLRKRGLPVKPTLQRTLVREDN